ncbi:MAG: guanylate kinase [Thermoleophilia bacterium]|nr:guanylate kinase [Thermoleophilia bacterium]
MGVPIARLIVISGPSGAGKGTLIRYALPKLEGPILSVSATTRPPRAGEQDGRDYYFLSEDDFRSWVAQGRFLEWAEYAGYLYGTPKEPVQRALDSGHDVILEIELKGADEILRQCPGAVVVFIVPPSLEELEKRLRKRRTEDEAAIQKRLARAKEELAEVARRASEGSLCGHYVIVNDEVERAGEQLVTILRQLHQDDEQTDNR